MWQDIFQCPVLFQPKSQTEKRKKICNLIIRFTETKIYRTSWVISSVQFIRSVVSDFFWPHGLQHTRPSCPSPTPSLLKLMSIESVMPSNHLILYCPLFLLSSIFSSIRVFLQEVSKYWSFRFNISPSNVYSGLISIRIDCFDLLAIQRTLKSLLQHHNSKALILWHSAFFMVSSDIHTWQLENPYLWLDRPLSEK